MSVCRSPRLGGLAVALAVVCAVPAGATAKTIVVKKHGSIQAAIDKAKPGTKIIVQRGTYHENLLITKDGIEVKGKGAVLTPPASPSSTPCAQIDPSGLTGICVVGDVTGGAGGAPPTVNKNVSGVTISGMTVKGFSGNGVFGFATKNLTLTHTRLLNNGSYGVFSNTSTGTRYLHNVVIGNHAPGLYIGDSPLAHAAVIGNRSLNNAGEGLLARDADFGSVHDNVFAGNCAGVLVLADAPGPATDWRVAHNDVRKNNKACAGDPGEGEPPLSGIGIALVGAANTRVENNSVNGNSAGSNPTLVSGGILVLTLPGGATAPKNDTIKNNHLSNNTPFDLSWDSTGTVTFTGNHCKTSSPGGLCSKSGKKK